ncbi:unnamed protein product [Gordionus sp. m RMFG-2023]|uniref:huntingtin-interacting protein 1-like n=1 Tax=Gordionus sp. m RMFG-2023 TaxID=3053472 RepID=UPI0030DFDF28
MNGIKITKQKEFLDSQINSIFKAMNLQETPVKEKHVRSIIIGSFVGIGCEVFWNVVMENMPLQGNQIVCWKFCYILYKLMRDGHHNTLTISLKYKTRIKDLGKLWGHLKDDFSPLIKNFCNLVSNKLDFHYKNPHFPNTLMIEQRELDKYYTNDDAYFQLSTELLDYLEDIIKLQACIFRSLELNNLNSLTLNGQCRVQPLIPCIQEAVLLYDHIVNIMLRLHANLDQDFLIGHRQRFLEMFKYLKKFFEEALRLQYLKNLVAIPQLSEHSPNFVKHTPVRLRKTQFKSTDDQENSPFNSSLTTSSRQPDTDDRKSLYQQTKFIAQRHPSIPSIQPDYARLINLIDDTSDSSSLGKSKENSSIDMLAQILAENMQLKPESEEGNVKSEFSKVDKRIQSPGLVEVKKVSDVEETEEEIDLTPYFHNGHTPSSSSKFNAQNPSFRTTQHLSKEDKSSNTEIYIDDRDNSKDSDRVDNYTDTQDLICKPSEEEEKLRISLENFKTRYETLKHMYENLRSSHFQLIKMSKITKLDKESQAENNQEFSNIPNTSTIDQNLSLELALKILAIFVQNFRDTIMNDTLSIHSSTLVPYFYNDANSSQASVQHDSIEYLTQSGTFISQILKSLIPIHQDEKKSDLEYSGKGNLTDYLVVLCKFFGGLMRVCESTRGTASNLYQDQISSSSSGKGKAEENIDNDFEMLGLEPVETDIPILLAHASSSNFKESNKLSNGFSVDKIAKNITFPSSILKLIDNLHRSLITTCKFFSDKTYNTTTETNELCNIYLNNFDTTNEIHPENFILRITTQWNTFLKYLANELLLLINSSITPSLIQPFNNDNLNEELAQCDKEIWEIFEDIDSSRLQLEKSISVLVTLPTYKSEDKLLLEVCNELMMAVKLLIEKAVFLQKEVCQYPDSQQIYYCKGDKWSEGFISAAKIVGLNAILLVENVNKLQLKSVKYEQIMTIAKEMTKNLAQLTWSAKVKSSKGTKNEDLVKELCEVSKSVGDKVHEVLKASKTMYIIIFQESLEVNLTNLSIHQAKLLEMESQIKVLELESQIEKERSKLLILRKRNYHLPETY